MTEKANNKTLIKNTGIIAIGNISTKLINFLLLPLYTSLISTEDYGTIDLLSTYTTLILAVVSLQLYQAVFRFVAVDRDDPEKTKSTITTIFGLSFIAAVVYAISFVILSPFFHFRQKWYLLFQVLANIYLLMTTNAARGIGDNSVYALSNFFSAAVTLVLNVLFLVVLRLNAMTMLWAYIIGPVAGGTMAFVGKKLWRYFSISQFNLTHAKEYLKYAAPLVPNELSWWVVHASDRTIISAVLGVAFNGLIAVASKFSSIYTTVFSVFNTAWTEQCVLHFNEEGGKKYIAETIVTVTRLFVCVTVGIVAFMPFVFPIMVDSKYLFDQQRNRESGHINICGRSYQHCCRFGISKIHWYVCSPNFLFVCIFGYFSVETLGCRKKISENSIWKSILDCFGYRICYCDCWILFKDSSDSNYLFSICMSVCGAF